jgi:MFS family permease
LNITLRIITGVLAAFSWLVALVFVNPLLFRFGDLHNWHGRGDPEWFDISVTVMAACGFAFSTAIAFGAPRWMLWPCLVLSLVVTLAWAAQAVPGLIRAFDHYRQEPRVIKGRFFQLWTYLGGALAMCLSAVLYSLLCFLSYRRRRA